VSSLLRTFKFFICESYHKGNFSGIIEKTGGEMAKPIKETPILYGKDAKRFLKEIQDNESKKISNKEYRRAMTIFDKVAKKNKQLF
jgi:hypothetical protein